VSNSHLAFTPPAAQMLGRMIERIDADGTAHLAFLAKPEFANRHGSVQGGIVSAMLDSATSVALLAQLAEDRTSMTVKLETEFLRPTPLGPLQARSWLMTRDERVASVRGELRDPAGALCATATAHFRILPRRR
jgi:uncharacterized protein (TIGR00369 family)